MAELVTVGETMMVMTPMESGPLRYQSLFGVRVAGAESNTAIGAAKLGHSSAWISRLGDDEPGMRVLQAVRGEGVDCGGVALDGGHRTGMMLKETGGRETRVYYYRENSAASLMSEGNIDWNVLRGAGILHLTGITPVLSPCCGQLAERLADFAQREGILLSFDPNIRKKLWKGTDFGPLLRELTLRAQIVLMGLPEAELLFGTADREKIRDILLERGNLKRLALKEGAEGAWVADADESFRIPPYPCRPVDPVGAGDAFNAGFLCGFLEGRPLEECGRMGAVAGAMAAETCGDYEGYPTKEQLRRILERREEIYR